MIPLNYRTLTAKELDRYENYVSRVCLHIDDEYVRTEFNDLLDIFDKHGAELLSVTAYSDTEMCARDAYFTLEIHQEQLLTPLIQDLRTLLDSEANPSVSIHDIDRTPHDIMMLVTVEIIYYF